MGWRRRSLLYVGIISVQVAFSGWHVLGEAALKDDTVPLVFACYREILAVFGMFLLAIPTEGLQCPKSEHLLSFLLIGVFNFMNVAGFILGMSLTNADLAAIYQCCIPVWSTVLGVMFRTEMINFAKVIGIGFSVTGAVITTYYSTKASPNSDGTNMLLGNALLICQSFGCAAMIVYQRQMLLIYPCHKSVVAWGYAPAALFSVLGSLYYVHDRGAWELGDGNEPVIALIYAAIVATMFTYTTMGWVNKHTSASTVAAFFSLQPVTTCVLNYFAEGVKITKMEVVGGAIVITGLFIVCWAKYKEEQDVARAFQDRLKHSLISHRNDQTPMSDDGPTQMTLDQSSQIQKSEGESEGDFYHTPLEKRTLMGTGYTPVSQRSTKGAPRLATDSKSSDGDSLDFLCAI